MKAQEIEPGDVLTDERGRVIYTVVRQVPEHWREGIAVLVRYEVDGGTDVRTFDPDQDVPLTRVRPITPSTEQARSEA
jgi:hypothetical protein